MSGARRPPVRAAAALAALMVSIVAAAVAAHAATSSGAVLPVALCRAGQRLLLLPPLNPGRLLTSWQLDLAALAVLVPLGTTYALLVRLVRHRGAAWPVSRSVAFGVGITVVLLATHSSIAVYDMTLFWVHMIQHLLLIMLAPALLVLGRPLTLLTETLPPGGRRRLERILLSRPLTLLTSPPVALATYAAVIVGTHLTGLMDTVMRHPWSGQVEHLVYLVAGLQFFLLIFGDEPIRWRLSMPGRLMLLVLSMAVDTFVGLVLLQTAHPIAMLPHPGWGPGLLSDTQAGGAVMWVGGDGLMAVLAIGLFLGWARRPEAAQSPLAWFEQVRRGLHVEHAAETAPSAAAAAPATGPPDIGAIRDSDIDDDDAALESYNRWLASLARRG